MCSKEKENNYKDNCTTVRGKRHVFVKMLNRKLSTVGRVYVRSRLESSSAAAAAVVVVAVELEGKVHLNSTWPLDLKGACNCYLEKESMN